MPKAYESRAQVRVSGPPFSRMTRAAPWPGSDVRVLDPQSLIRLQRAAGNAAVVALQRPKNTAPAPPTSTHPPADGARTNGPGVAVPDTAMKQDWMPIGGVFPGRTHHPYRHTPEERTRILAQLNADQLDRVRDLVGQFGGLDPAVITECRAVWKEGPDGALGGHWSFVDKTSTTIARAYVGWDTIRPLATGEHQDHLRVWMQAHTKQLSEGIGPDGVTTVDSAAATSKPAANATTNDNAGPSSLEGVVTAAADLATDVTPGVSNVKDAYTAITGRNPVTGEKVGTAGRLMAAIFAIPGLGNVLKWVKKGPGAAARLGKAIGRTRLGRWITEGAGRIFGNAKRSGITPTPGSTLAVPGGLKSMEGRRVPRVGGRLSPPAHALGKHGPDVPLSQLRNSALSGRTGTRATKFTDRANMEESIASVLSARQRDVQTWLAGPPTPNAGVNKVFAHHPGMGPLGAGFEKTTSGLVTLQGLEGVQIVLKADGAGGYVLQTAFPIP